MVAKLDKVMHDFIMLSGWKKSLGAFVILENDHNYGVGPELDIYEYSVSRLQTSTSATNKPHRKFQVLTQKESLTS